MFEVAELGHRISKQEYNKEVPVLRAELLSIQQEMKNAGFPVIILISGVDGGGKGRVINLLNEWMDPRYIRTYAFGAETEEERERPSYWRYWMALPPKGHTGIYVGSWYSDPIAKRVRGKIDNADLDAELIHIKKLEKELVDDGALIIKCWLHLSEDGQRKRLKSLEKNPETRWRVTRQDKKHLKLYEKFSSIAERTLRETSTGEAPWLIVEGTDNRYSSLTVGKHILGRIRKHLEHTRLLNEQRAQMSNLPMPVRDEMSVLGSLELSQALEKKTYNQELEKYQGKLNKLSRAAYARKISSLLVFEGWDAGGKGGAIRRLVHAMDARHYRVIPVAAPTDEENAHHYLWRFWRHIPRGGMVTIYDRSWYGRVLVERIEGFARDDEWMRAYSEINDFEEELTDHGIVLMKYWLHISQEEQLARFKEREKIAYKKYKITEEDYRNRERWDDYETSVNDMVTRTSTEYAPWHLVESNDKRFARVKVLKTYCEALEKRLDNEK